MALPASGQISFSQIAQIVYDNAGAGVSLNDADVRYLLATSTGQISITAGYLAPAAVNYPYSSPGSYSLVVPPYQYMTVYAYGGGQGGQGGSGGGTCTQWCGVYCFVSYCCNVSGPGPGGDGGSSSFSSPNGVTVIGYAGTNGGGNGGGSGGTVTVGGGGGGGGGGGATGCAGSTGATGYSGGLCVGSFVKAAPTGAGPLYGSTCSIYVGGGGGTSGNGGNGGNGYVQVNVA